MMRFRDEALAVPIASDAATIPDAEARGAAPWRHGFDCLTDLWDVQGDGIHGALDETRHARGLIGFESWTSGCWAENGNRMDCLECHLLARGCERGPLTISWKSAAHLFCWPSASAYVPMALRRCRPNPRAILPGTRPIRLRI